MISLLHTSIVIYINTTRLKPIKVQYQPFFCGWEDEDSIIQWWETGRILTWELRKKHQICSPMPNCLPSLFPLSLDSTISLKRFWIITVLFGPHLTTSMNLSYFLVQLDALVRSPQHSSYLSTKNNYLEFLSRDSTKKKGNMSHR